MCNFLYWLHAPARLGYFDVPVQRIAEEIQKDRAEELIGEFDGLLALAADGIGLVEDDLQVIRRSGIGGDPDIRHRPGLQLGLAGAGGEDRRPVVKMSMCVGDRVYEEQFSLRDRGDMNYTVLLGRRTIEHIGLIDTASTYLLPLDCPPDAAQQERDRLAELQADASLIDDSRMDDADEQEEAGSQEDEE